MARRTLTGALYRAARLSEGRNLAGFRPSTGREANADVTAGEPVGEADH